MGGPVSFKNNSTPPQQYSLQSWIWQLDGTNSTFTSHPLLSAIFYHKSSAHKGRAKMKANSEAHDLN